MKITRMQQAIYPLEIKGSGIAARVTYPEADDFRTGKKTSIFSGTEAGPVFSILSVGPDVQAPSKSWDDLHRYAGSLLGTEGDVATFRANVEAFIKEYGDIFIPEAHVSGKHPVTGKVPTLKDWWVEFMEVSLAAKAAEMGSLDEFGKPDPMGTKDLLINEKLKQFTVPRMSGSEIELKPTCLAGWLWALVARDQAEGITYAPCAADDCSREVPSKNTNNRPQKFCRVACKKRTFRKGNQND